ncbi:DMT family transporter [Micromonospora sp. NPDC049559]|uniref:DMT family transporter n=1 Tax=Micromonospora sp. NPDC049559 TaxID=3155923 RepID=UPI00343867F5
MSTRHRAGAFLAHHPATSTAAGALCVSASGVFIGLAHTTPGTVSFYRSVLALPFLAALARLESGERRATRAGSRVLAWVAGALLAGDMLFWTPAVAELGAGPSTVVVNLQVVLVPLIAWLVDREPVPGQFLLLIPPLLLGVALTGGVLGGATGDDPTAGLWHAAVAALCYAGFLYLLRRGSGGGGGAHAMLHVTLASALTSLLAGSAWQGIRFGPDPATLGWLLALSVSGQVIGWLLVASASARLPSRTSAVLLLLTPVGALALGALVLGENPDVPQLAGCALVLATVPLAAAGAPRRRAPQPDPSRRATTPSVSRG